MKWISDKTLVNSSVFSEIGYYMKYFHYWPGSYSGVSAFKSGTGTEDLMLADGIAASSFCQVYCERSGKQFFQTFNFDL